MHEKPERIDVSMDQLIGLCDEMRALVRSGVPLERGLKAVAKDLPAEQGALAAEIGRRGAAGESLEQILGREEIKVPELFRCIVLAGIRSGRLSAALEGMATTSRRIVELRRTIVQAMIYPLIVVSLIAVLTVGVLGPLRDLFEESRDVHRLGLDETIAPAFQWLGEWMWVLAPVAVLAFLIWWLLTARAYALQPRLANAWYFWLPWTRRLLAHGRLATFIEVLAMLIENDVPLHEALTLAARASGDRALTREAVELSSQIEAGKPVEADHATNAIPPLVRWQIVSHGTKARLVASLKSMAQSERRRADYLAEWLRIQLPVILTVGIGGSVTLVYALAVLLPWYSMMGEITDPMAMQR